MKSIFIATIPLFFLFTSLTKVAAQDEINDFLNSSVADGEKLVGAYIDPLMKGLSLGMNQGWYNTAKPHKLLGFDLTLTANLMYVPDEDLLFDPASLGLTQIQLVDPVTGNPISGSIPTFFGKDTPPTFSPNVTPGIPFDDFEGPGGVDLEDEIGSNFVPVPIVQLGFGLPKGTDVKFRFVPSVEVGDGDFKLYGVGIMHDIKQYMPGIKKLPFDLSLFAGYTHLELDVAFDAANPDQRGEFEVNSTNFQAIISKKIAVLTLYGGMGYNIAKSNLAVKGTYDFTFDGQVTDPVDLSFGASGFRGTAGLRLKFAVFTLHADYTVQKYNALSVGFGINVR